VPLSALIVIVSTWFVLTALVSVAGVIWIFASTQVLLASPLPPAAVFTAVPVVRVAVSEKPPTLTVIAELAEITLVPVVADVITTVHVCGLVPAG
jgi:hypothetical protein